MGSCGLTRTVYTIVHRAGRGRGVWRRVTRRGLPRVVRGTRTLGAIVFSYRHSFVTRGRAEVRLYCCHKDLGFLSRSFFLARPPLSADVVSIERTVSRFTQISGEKGNLSASPPHSLYFPLGRGGGRGYRTRFWNLIWRTC